METLTLGQQIRCNTLEILHLISSRQDQLNYQRDVPLADVSHELCCLWEDCFQREWTEEDWFQNAFSQAEREAMQRFDEVMDRTLQNLGGSLPPIEQFVLTPQWEQLSQQAKLALRPFNSNTH